MEFLRNAWYVAMWSEQLAEGQLMPRKMLGEPVVLYRDAQGRATALSDICPHRFAPMHRGSIKEDGRLQCGYHGLQFDRDGNGVFNPHGRGVVPPGCRLRSYPAVEKHSIVWLWMGDLPARPEAIPDFSFLDDDAGFVVSKRDVLVMDASYRLVIDNLMDLSHVPFLHDGLLGNATTIRSDPKIEQRGDEIFVTRDKFNARPPGLLDKLFRDDGAPVDAWQTIRWTPPSNLLNDSGVFPVGGDRADGAGLYGAHLLTPVDENRTMYHFAAARHGVPLASKAREEELRETLSVLRRHAFEQQDEPMIEAQADMIREYPHLTAHQVVLQSDVGVVRSNRVLDQLIALERDAAKGEQP